MSDGIFAMGSCFAKELERTLIRRGGTVLSVDESIRSAAFMGSKGVPDEKFFHRFTPVSISQEFCCGFGDIHGWDDASTLLFGSENGTLDFHYGWDVTGDVSHAAAVTRRQVARALVSKAKRARLVVITLGLIEAWYHKPTGLYCNKIAPKIVMRHPNEFEFRLLEYEDVMQALHEVVEVLTRHHETGQFDLLVTVSPVPLQKTFSGLDVIVANTESKAVQRAAAGAFARLHENVHYFPSYELVQYSNPDLAWRPDRVHVNPEMVGWIMDRFIEAVYEGSDPKVVVEREAVAAPSP
jgi:hypothetical protein